MVCADKKDLDAVLTKAQDYLAKHKEPKYSRKWLEEHLAEENLTEDEIGEALAGLQWGGFFNINGDLDTDKLKNANTFLRKKAGCDGKGV